jgi:hypothetical protein
MLILFETPAGFALFKANEKKLEKADVASLFATPEAAADVCVQPPVGREEGRRVWGGGHHPGGRSRSPSRCASAGRALALQMPCSVKLKAFYKFANTTEALSAAAAMVESKLSSELKSFIKKNIVKKELTDELGVADKVRTARRRGRAGTGWPALVPRVTLGTRLLTAFVPLPSAPPTRPRRRWAAPSRTSSACRWLPTAASTSSCAASAGR